MERRSKKNTTLSPISSEQIKLQCPPIPPPPNYKHKLPNGLSYYPTKPNLQGSSSIYHSLKDGILFGAGSSIGKEVVNNTLLFDSQRDNQKINKCELLKQHIQECMQNESTCNHLFESYLIQCSL